ncbi:polysaccharide pyruvyl transferase family protein [Microbacterium sp. ZKA21]|uniref:polysaccharide pyruvyl transferase family protein n=1 Tax=Microbacterium sp. ZKA21 TaxID=3381694 RepID=UPI003D1E0FA1
MIFRRDRQTKFANDAIQRELETELRGLLKPRIGITGSFGRGNYGDELFVRVYEHWLGQWADLTLLTALHRPWYFRDIRTTQADLMDAVVLGGGDLLCPYREWIDPDFINPMYLRRPVHVAGIGVENDRVEIDSSVVERWTDFLTHPSVRSISTRDVGSAEWITEQINPHVRVTSHADLVCALPLPPVDRREDTPILGIVTRYARDPKDYRQLEEIAAAFISKGWHVRHIIGGVEDHGRRDLRNAEQLRVEGKETFHSNQIDDVTRALGECSLLLSMKLHTTIVATMYGVPTVSIHPVPKTRAFMASIGREELVVEPTDPRLFTILEEGVPDVSMDKVDELRAQAVAYLKELSQRIWDDYRNASAARQHVLPATVAWVDGDES